MNTNYKYFVNQEQKNATEVFNVTGNYSNADADYIELLDGEAQPLTSGQTQPYILSVANASPTLTISNVLIMGANQNLPLASTNYGNPTLIELTSTYAITISMGISGITYGEFLFQTLTQPFTCCQLYFFCQRPAQLFVPLTLQHKDSDGRLCQDPIVPLLDPYQKLNRVVIKDECFTVDGNTMITLSSINANTTVNVYVFASKKIDMRNNLLGAPTQINYKKTELVQPKKLNFKYAV